MLIKSLVAVAAILVSTAALAGDPAGSYSVRGSNPGNGNRYSGSVDVEKTGDTYRVTWDIGGQTYVGTAIANSSGIAVTYRSGNTTGLAIYSAKGDDWEGAWTYAGGKQIGGEAWIRK